jgi:hypothetical protein
MDSKYYVNHTVAQSQTSPELKDESLDKFISQRSSILSSKLEVLMHEILARFAIKKKSLNKISEDVEKINDTLQDLSPKAFYIADSAEKDEFHKLRHKSLDLEKEKRDHDSSCWNDVVPVVRDLLNTWEAHQQSSARAQLLKSNGLKAIVNETYPDDGGQLTSQ